MSGGWKAGIGVAVVAIACSPLALVVMAMAGFEAQGGDGCLAALAAAPPTNTTVIAASLFASASVSVSADAGPSVSGSASSPAGGGAGLPSACDGGDGLPDDGQLPHLPAGYTLPSNAQQATVVAFALAQLGEPYVFGAAGPHAWDCSGLVMAAWRQVGVHLTHSTYYMVNEGTTVPSLRAMQPGDLIFIPGSDGTTAHPGHVGMYIGRAADGQQYLIQAPHTGSTVRTTPVNSWASHIVKIIRPVIP